MALKDILAISGKGGLFKFVSQGRNGIIVESLIDQKRSNVPASAKISALEDIAIFTTDEEVPLAKVMKTIKDKEEGKELAIKASDNVALKALMEEILPEYDKERVYVSDIKKVVSWYNLLAKNDLLDLVEEDEEENKEDTADEVKDAEIVEESEKELSEEAGEEKAE